MFVNWWAQAGTTAIDASLIRHDELAIRSIQGAATCAKNTIEELTVDATGTYSNPFDPTEVSLDADVTGPGSLHYQIPGFIYRPYNRTLIDGVETLTPSGPSVWKIRVTPTEPGHYQMTIRFRDHSGQKVKEFQFDATSSDQPGVARVSSHDPHYFATSASTSIYPVGTNLLWAGPRGTFDYDDWIGRMSQSGLNLERVLLNSSVATFAMERTGSAEEGRGPGRFDLGNSWKLDHVLDTARRSGIYSLLCLDQAGELNIRDASPDWPRSPLNRDNGGPLRVWTEFWTDPKALQIYRNRLRYLVARFAADPNLFGWELWRNVDQVQEYDPLLVRSWHAKIASDLKKLDPYQHLVTTGFSNPSGDRDTYLQKGLDFAEMHVFSPKPVGLIADQLSRHAEWGKPTLITETAADSSLPHDLDDPNGQQFHDPLWIGVSTGAAGGALPWWWREYVDKDGFTSIAGIFQRFTKGIDFANEVLRQSDATLAFLSNREQIPNSDLVLDSAPDSGSGASQSNRPQMVNVVADRVMGPAPAHLLNGMKIHPEQHNPLTIFIREAVASKLCIHVQKVSALSAAHLTVSVDGVKALDEELAPAATGPNVTNNSPYRYFIPIEKGTHQILVENTGDDSLQVEYKIVGVVPVKAPPANIWSLVGNSTAIVWVQQKGWNWQSAVLEKQTFNPVPQSNAALSDLASGSWDYQIWDTWKGDVIGKGALNVGLDGKATLPLPAFTSDLAIKLTRKK